jgi:hypothetical protein
MYLQVCRPKTPKWMGFVVSRVRPRESIWGLFLISTAAGGMRCQKRSIQPMFLVHHVFALFSFLRDLVSTIATKYLLVSTSCELLHR